MSHRPGEDGGLSQATPNVNPTQAMATENTPEGQVRARVIFSVVCQSLFPVALPSMAEDRV